MDGDGLSPRSSMEVKGCMSLELDMLAAGEARTGETCRGLGVFTSVGEPWGTVSEKNFCIFADGSPDCCGLSESTFCVRT